MSTASSVPEPDRISQIMEYLNDPTLDLPDSLKNFKYMDGFNPDKLEEELEQHPFFMTELPDPSKPLPPLLEAFQQLKYSETDNTSHELACSHKEDGLYHFKLKKYRIATTCFSSALSYELKESSPDPEFLAQVYNNRSACSFFLKNYRSCARDCQQAVSLVPSYFKPFKRGVLALTHLERWDEVEQMCTAWENHHYGNSSDQQGSSRDNEAFVCDARMKARRGAAHLKSKERAKRLAVKEEEATKAKVMAMINDRGISLKDHAFLGNEAAANNGKVVTVLRLDDDEEGNEQLAWPVLFMYPQYSQSDFIEAFAETTPFAAHLSEMLDNDNGPAWDKDREYVSGNVDIYYLNNKLVKLDPEQDLLSVMQQPTYAVPGNGVPSFFVLAKNNRFCEDFIERVALA